MKNLKRLLTLVMTLLTVVAISSMAIANASNKTTDGPIYDEAGEVVGYTYGGIYWTVDEYEQCMSTVNTRAYVVNHSASLEDDGVVASSLSALYGVEMTPEEMNAIQNDVKSVAMQLGMPIAMEDAEDGYKTILLGGYTFKVADDTEMASLMRRLEDWNYTKSPYEKMFFSQDWTYQTVKTKSADSDTNISIDTDSKTIAFYVYESIDEIELVDTLTALRTAALVTEK